MVVKQRTVQFNPLPKTRWRRGNLLLAGSSLSPDPDNSEEGRGRAGRAGEEGSQAEGTASAGEYRRGYQGKMLRGQAWDGFNTHSQEGGGGFMSFFEVAGVAPAVLCYPARLLQVQAKELPAGPFP